MAGTHTLSHRATAPLSLSHTHSHSHSLTHTMTAIMRQNSAWEGASMKKRNTIKYSKDFQVQAVYKKSWRGQAKRAGMLKASCTKRMTTKKPSIRGLPRWGQGHWMSAHQANIHAPAAAEKHHRRGHYAVTSLASWMKMVAKAPKKAVVWNMWIMSKVYLQMRGWWWWWWWWIGHGVC